MSRFGCRPRRGEECAAKIGIKLGLLDVCHARLSSTVWKEIKTRVAGCSYAQNWRAADILMPAVRGLPQREVLRVRAVTPPILPRAAVIETFPLLVSRDRRTGPERRVMRNEDTELKA
jgi:hypothetical protein